MCCGSFDYDIDDQDHRLDRRVHGFDRGKTYTVSEKIFSVTKTIVIVAEKMVFVAKTLGWNGQANVRLSSWFFWSSNPLASLLIRGIHSQIQPID